MPENQNINPAAEAARVALELLFRAIDEQRSFIFEAGAGAGKTYSLVKALHYLIERNGKALAKAHKRIACITYTNVAKEEIDERTDRHPIVHSDTIHGFCWSVIRNFQDEIRRVLPSLSKWDERIKEYYENQIAEQLEIEGEHPGTPVPAGRPYEEVEVSEILGKKEVIYQLGYPSIDDDVITLYHDDVLNLMIHLLSKDKFRKILFSKYPIILIDEYQDTFGPFADALQTHFITPGTGPQIGFFGDHWQKIYGTGCGKIENERLVFIPKNANFRSVATVVNILNSMRPELRQEVEDPDSEGMARAYHTNSWIGARRTGQHWGGDLPSETAHDYLTQIRFELEQSDWDFVPEKTKILMLTHNVLADEQGYRTLADVFPYNDSYIKKEDKYMAYLMDVIEPLCAAFIDKKYGAMFSIIGNTKSGIRSHSEKVEWHGIMTRMLELRENGTIGEMLDHIRESGKPRLPEAVEKAESKFRDYVPVEGEEEPKSISRTRALRVVPYSEVIAVTKFVNNHTPFATNHSVKGEEYENVLVVVGRGWNLYNFDQMLGWFNDGVPAQRQDTFERARNLFYVACSRPKNNLAILFTQQLSGSALSTLHTWFGAENVIALPQTPTLLN